MLKRSPLKRKTPLKQKGGPRRTRKRAAQAKRPGGSSQRWRSEDYLAWVRQQPCCVCGAPADSAHHLAGMWQVSGMGLKAPDSLVMPVCDGPGVTCHRRIHACKGLQAEQPRWLRHTIALGMQEFDGEIYEALREALAFINEKESVK